MGKALSEMSLGELWQLFPIVLTAHQPCWARWYSEEAAALRTALPPAVQLNHIGSTAVATIWAKPIIDILAETPDEADFGELEKLLAAQGYRCMSRDPLRLSFNKGYTESGFAERVFHLHLRVQGDCDELIFRDYLNAHPETAKEYEALKLTLWKQYEHDRDGYTNAKTAFIRKYTELGKQAPAHPVAAEKITHK